MLVDRLGHGAEDDAGLLQLLLEGGDDGDAVEHGIDRNLRGLDASQNLLLAERNAELLVDAQQFGIDIVDRLRTRRRFRRRIIIEFLIVDLWIVDARPFRPRHGQPAAIGVQPPVEQPTGLVLLG